MGNGGEMNELTAKALVSVAICAIGAYCMLVTDGDIGVGWAVLGLCLVRG
jgi:hypothetical protein